MDNLPSGLPCTRFRSAERRSGTLDAKGPQYLFGVFLHLLLHLEKNVQAMTDIQAKLAEQSKGVTPEMWAQFMNVQSPMMQGMMGNYVEQSRNMFTQMQEQMQKQTEQMFGAFGLKR